MAKPVVDADLCIGCGSCEEICPDVFEVSDDGISRIIATGDCEAAGCCEEAVEECPVDAITLE